MSARIFCIDFAYGLVLVETENVAAPQPSHRESNANSEDIGKQLTDFKESS